MVVADSWEASDTGEAMFCRGLTSYTETTGAQPSHMPWPGTYHRGYPSPNKPDDMTRSIADSSRPAGPLAHARQDTVGAEQAVVAQSLVGAEDLKDGVPPSPMKYE